MADGRTKSELDLLKVVEEESVISQSALSEKLGIAVGLVNFLMKRAVSKGFVVTKRVPARRYAYFLTPKGFAEKARLVTDYMRTSLNMFRHLRNDLDDVFVGLDSDAGHRVIVVGDMELAELAMLAALAHDLEIAAVVCAKTNRTRMGQIPITSNLELVSDILSLSPTDVFLVADIYEAQNVYDSLCDQFGVARVVTPKSLHVITRSLDDMGSAASSAGERG